MSPLLKPQASHLSVSLLSHVSVVPCVLPTLLSPRLDHQSVAKHGPRSATCAQVSQLCLETRPMESKHACKFLGSLTRLEPTARSCGSLVKAQASARVDVPTALHFFHSTDQGVQHVCTSFIFRECLDLCVNGMCARPTTHHDPECVIHT